jgi:hypothetical protein
LTSALYWDRQSKIKIWKLKDNIIKDKFRNIVRKSTLEAKSIEEEWVRFEKIFILRAIET